MTTRPYLIYLAEEGYSICQAETAGAGLEALKRHNITHTVVLNAISMRTNGARTCVSLKKAAPSLPILVYSDQEKPAKADMLVRPGLSISRLVNCIEIFSPLDKHKQPGILVHPLVEPHIITTPLLEVHPTWFFSITSMESQLINMSR